jgi:uncharacterized membrane protein
MSDWGPDLLDAMYVLLGVLLALTGVRALLDEGNPRRLTTAAFWLILGVIFAFGEEIDAKVIGVLVIVLGALTFARGVAVGTVVEGTEEEKEAGAARLGNWLFVPALALAGIAVLISTKQPFGEQSGTVSIGVASVLALLIAWILTRAKPTEIVEQTDRLIRQVGPVGMLPQFLAMLGVVFTSAGVGEVVSDAISGIIPDGSKLAGVIAYCLGMALFTAVVGNAFAAHTVITAGIGAPFVFALGGDPVIAGALAMTAGFCGTLCTPMAANFNALPVALMQMKDENGVIKAQVPIAAVMFLIHIVLMYVWAF